MKHIRHYPKVKKAMEAYFAREREAIMAGVRILRDSLDGKDRGKFVQNCRFGPMGGECLREDLDHALKDLTVSLPREERRWAERLERADGAPRLAEMNMRVDWHGRRAKAIAFVSMGDDVASECARGTGIAGGLGYDRRSAAMSCALEFKEASDKAALASIDRFVIEHGEGLWKEYAVERVPFPHLDFSGKGADVFTRLFHKIGDRKREVPVKDYVIDYSEDAEGTDVYHVIRKGRI